MATNPKTTASLAKGADIGQIIEMTVGAATGIATSIASVKDDRLRSKFQQNLDVLSNDQQIKLAIALNNAKSEDERLAILSQVLSNLSTQRIGNLEAIIAEQEKNKRNKILTTTIETTAVILVAGIVIYVAFKK